MRISCYQFGLLGSFVHINFSDLFFEPTDRRKAAKALYCKQHMITYSSPNLSELRSMARFLKPNSQVKEKSDIEEIINLSKIVTQYIQVLIVTLGDKGVITISRTANEKDNRNEEMLNVRCYATEKLNTVENVSGAGDCFASGYIHGIISGYEEPFCVSLGFAVAKSALLCKNTVPTNFQIQSKISASSYKKIEYF